MRTRAALVGCGAMADAWLSAVSATPDVEIVAFVDLDLARAVSRATSYGRPDVLTSTSLAEVLDRAAPDVVFDVVVPGARHGVVSAALAAGCHVLSEKPMAPTLAEARDLIARAKAAGRLHAIVQNRRYLAAVRRIARVLASGVIGEVTSVHADFFLAPHFGGFREEMDHVLLLDMAIHTFDAMRCMTGLDAAGVIAREWDPPGSWYRQGSSAVAVFELTGGAVFTYRGSWAQEGIRTSWEAAWRICGTRGSLLWDGYDDIRAEVAGERSGLLATTTVLDLPALDPGDRIGGHAGVLGAFLDAVKTGVPPETVGFENIKSLAMVLSAIESASTGRAVSIAS